MINALSIDLEEWYDGLISLRKDEDVELSKLESRIEVQADFLLRLLARYDQTATFFVLGHIAESFPELLRRMEEAGHEVGSHGYLHRPVSDLTPDQFKEDISRSLQALETAVNHNIKGYRAPLFSVKKTDNWVFDILNEHGFDYDASLSPFQNPLYGDSSAPRFPFKVKSVGGELWEVPISTMNILGHNVPFAGGFYMRALPLRVVKKGIEKVNQAGFPAILYLHPWELDQTQPKPENINLRERITHYWNLRSTEGRLKSLFEEFQFGQVGNILFDYLK